jgi:hypothetical protein
MEMNTNRFISNAMLYVIPACRESFFTIPNKSEGLRTSRNDRSRQKDFILLLNLLITPTEDR